MVPNRVSILALSSLAALSIAGVVVAESVGGDRSVLRLAGFAPAPTPSADDIDAVFGNQSPDAQPFTEAQALERLSALAARQLSNTLGSDRNPDGPLLIDGEPVHPDHLSLIELRRFEDATEVVSGQSVSRWGEPKTVWLARWERENVFIESWGDYGTVRVKLIIEDRTGKLMSANVSQFNPDREVGRD